MPIPYMEMDQWNDDWDDLLFANVEELYPMDPEGYEHVL